MPVTRILSIALLSAGLCFAAVPVTQAATEAPFSQQAFETSQKNGQPILVEITAPWCPTCARQKPTLDALKADPAFDQLMVFKVDFDTQKDALRALGAQMQSTLIAYRGTTERGRSTGETNPDAIRSLVAKVNN